MSLQIIKSGILDTIQDCGRYGFQHLGINPGGAMDLFSAQLSNSLLGKNLDSPVIEIHFPASQILFEKETIICITGANFSPEINHQKIPIVQPVVINKKSVLQFKNTEAGARCYLSVLHEIALDKWLNSYSTNLKAAAGGWHGRSLQKGDALNFKNIINCEHLVTNKDFSLLQWRANLKNKNATEIRFIPGNEWDWLSEDAKNIFQEGNYQVSNNSDRMGYRLRGKELKLKENKQLVSSAVTFGTIQLLPDGQLIVLMADHQTTGGYPRPGHVISVDLPLLAQKKPGDKIIFCVVEKHIAEQELIEQQKYLQQLQTACKFKIENLLNVTL
jgi:antagonist of KipI